eukprot:Rmarinus@m.1253
MASRRLPWRNKPPDKVARRMEEALTARFYLLQEVGPTCFVLKGDTGDLKKYKVSIGETHTCTCLDSRQELCAHILFVLLKVFRLPKDDPLVWQRSLLDREVSDVLRARYVSRDRLNRRRGSTEAKKAVEPAEVTRKELEEGATCPICLDDMSEQQSLSFCSSGCGNHLHTRCLKEYRDHHRGLGDKLQCPLCRCDWRGEIASMKVAKRDLCHVNVKCRGCGNQDFTIPRYKCLLCTDFNFCEMCFSRFRRNIVGDSTFPSEDTDPSSRRVSSAASHSRLHSFTCRSTPDSEWRPVPPPPPKRSEQNSAALRELQSREITDADYELLLALGAPPELEKLDHPEIERIPWFYVQIGSSCKGRTCKVCMKLFVEGDEVRTLSCSHHFHKDCIDTWLVETSCCCPIDCLHALDSSPSALVQFLRRAVPSTKPKPPKTGTGDNSSVQRTGINNPSRGGQQRVLSAFGRSTLSCSSDMTTDRSGAGDSSSSHTPLRTQSSPAVLEMDCMISGQSMTHSGHSGPGASFSRAGVGAGALAETGTPPGRLTRRAPLGSTRVAASGSGALDAGSVLGFSDGMSLGGVGLIRTAGSSPSSAVGPVVQKRRSSRIRHGPASTAGSHQPSPFSASIEGFQGLQGSRGPEGTASGSLPPLNARFLGRPSSDRGSAGMAAAVEGEQQTAEAGASSVGEHEISFSVVGRDLGPLLSAGCAMDGDGSTTRDGTARTGRENGLRSVRDSGSAGREQRGRGRRGRGWGRGRPVREATDACSSDRERSQNLGSAGIPVGFADQPQNRHLLAAGDPVPRDPDIGPSLNGPGGGSENRRGERGVRGGRGGLRGSSFARQQPDSSGSLSSTVEPSFVVDGRGDAARSDAESGGRSGGGSGGARRRSSGSAITTGARRSSGRALSDAVRSSRVSAVSEHGVSGSEVLSSGDVDTSGDVAGVQVTGLNFSTLSPQPTE